MVIYQIFESSCQKIVKIVCEFLSDQLINYLQMKSFHMALQKQATKESRPLSVKVLVGYN